ncbi:hypothetical protein KC315_g62 [Hortaea werneckii]|nr:hypothetical protein KC315_g62 [Hortaea werneckii]
MSFKTAMEKGSFSPGARPVVKLRIGDSVVPFAASMRYRTVYVHSYFMVRLSKSGVDKFLRIQLTFGFFPWRHGKEREGMDRMKSVAPLPSQRGSGNNVDIVGCVRSLWFDGRWFSEPFVALAVTINAVVNPISDWYCRTIVWEACVNVAFIVCWSSLSECPKNGNAGKGFHHCNDWTTFERESFYRERDRPKTLEARTTTMIDPSGAAEDVIKVHTVFDPLVASKYSAPRKKSAMQRPGISHGRLHVIGKVIRHWFRTFQIDSSGKFVSHANLPFAPSPQPRPTRTTSW